MSVLQPLPQTLAFRKREALNNSGDSTLDRTPLAAVPSSHSFQGSPDGFNSAVSSPQSQQSTLSRARKKGAGFGLPKVRLLGLGKTALMRRPPRTIRQKKSQKVGKEQSKANVQSRGKGTGSTSPRSNEPDDPWCNNQSQTKVRELLWHGERLSHELQSNFDNQAQALKVIREKRQQDFQLPELTNYETDTLAEIWQSTESNLVLIERALKNNQRKRNSSIVHRFAPLSTRAPRQPFKHPGVRLEPEEQDVKPEEILVAPSGVYEGDSEEDELLSSTMSDIISGLPDLRRRAKVKTKAELSVSVPPINPAFISPGVRDLFQEEGLFSPSEESQRILPSIQTTARQSSISSIGSPNTVLPLGQSFSIPKVLASSFNGASASLGSLGASHNAGKSITLADIEITLEP